MLSINLELKKLSNSSGNSFTTFSSSLFDLLPSLTSLDISENPIECDCGVKEFIEFAQKEDSKFLNQVSDLDGLR